MDKKNFETFWNEWVANIWPWLLSSGLRVLIILIGGILVYFAFRLLLAKVIRIASRHQESGDRLGEQQREKTLRSIFQVILQVVIGVIMLMMILVEFGLKITPLLASAGVVGLALGFGGQYVIKDLLSGMFIILENQYRIDDVVRIGGLTGKVEKMSLRITTLRDLDGNMHFIPHGTIDQVSNLSKSFSRVNLDIPVAFGTDIEKLIEIVNRVGNELYADETWAEFMLEAPQFMRVQDLGETGVLIKIIGNVKPSQQWMVSGELRKRLYKAFAEENIELGVPVRTLKMEAARPQA